MKILAIGKINKNGIEFTQQESLASKILEDMTKKYLDFNSNLILK